MLKLKVPIKEGYTPIPISLSLVDFRVIPSFKYISNLDTHGIGLGYGEKKKKPWTHMFILKSGPLSFINVSGSKILKLCHTGTILPDAPIVIWKLFQIDAYVGKNTF